MKKIIISLFLSIFFISIGNYAFAIEPDVFIKSTVNKASNILSNDEISKEEKIIGLKKIAKDTVDINGIGFYTLGSFRKNLKLKIVFFVTTSNAYQVCTNSSLKISILAAMGH